jgi:hypothetical protein
MSDLPLRLTLGRGTPLKVTIDKSGVERSGVGSRNSLTRSLPDVSRAGAGVDDLGEATEVPERIQRFLDAPEGTTSGSHMDVEALELEVGEGKSSHTTRVEVDYPQRTPQEWQSHVDSLLEEIDRKEREIVRKENVIRRLRRDLDRREGEFKSVRARVRKLNLDMGRMGRIN